jgi:hypothetical protein
METPLIHHHYSDTRSAINTHRTPFVISKGRSVRGYPNLKMIDGKPYYTNCKKVYEKEGNYHIRFKGKDRVVPCDLLKEVEV